MFNTLVFLSILVAAVATYLGLKSGLPVKTLVRITIPYCLLLIPVTGALTGSVAANGGEIPGWFLGLVNAAFTFFAVVITLGIMLLRRNKTEK